MKNIRTRAIIWGLISILLTGCTNRVLDFTLVSSKNVDLSKGATFVRGKSRVKGKDLVHWIIIIPTGSVSIKEALDKAIESTPGCVALLDGVIYTKSWWIPYIYGQQSAIVEGTPLIDPSLSLNSSDIPAYGRIEMDGKNRVNKVEEISEKEYYIAKNKIVKQTKEKSFSNSEEL